MNDSKCIADFSSSLLGTQEYWNEAYERELKNYHEVGDVGEIWFGKETQNRIITWLIKSGCSLTDNLIDLGCGNGMLLLTLREKGFTNLTGIDYSKSAIHLSKSIAVKEDFADITFQVCDLLNSSDVKSLCKSQTFNICLDKGTYDAISLKDVSNPDNNKVYCHNVRTLLNKDGILVITSCNWTRQQLEQQFQNDFILIHEIPAPKFTFGGRTGQTVTTLVLKRKPDPE